MEKIRKSLSPLPFHTLSEADHIKTLQNKRDEGAKEKVAQQDKSERLFRSAFGIEEGTSLKMRDDALMISPRERNPIAFQNLAVLLNRAPENEPFFYMDDKPIYPKIMRNTIRTFENEELLRKAFGIRNGAPTVIRDQASVEDQKSFNSLKARLKAAPQDKPFLFMNGKPTNPEIIQSAIDKAIFKPIEPTEKTRQQDTESLTGAQLNQSAARFKDMMALKQSLEGFISNELDAFMNGNFPKKNQTVSDAITATASCFQEVIEATKKPLTVVIFNKLFSYKCPGVLACEAQRKSLLAKVANEVGGQLVPNDGYRDSLVTLERPSSKEFEVALRMSFKDLEKLGGTPPERLKQAFKYFTNHEDSRFKEACSKLYTEACDKKEALMGQVIQESPEQAQQRIRNKRKEAKEAAEKAAKEAAEKAAKEAAEKAAKEAAEKAAKEAAAAKEAVATTASPAVTPPPLVDAAPLVSSLKEDHSIQTLPYISQDENARLKQNHDTIREILGQILATLPENPSAHELLKDALKTLETTQTIPTSAGPALHDPKDQSRASKEHEKQTQLVVGTRENVRLKYNLLRRILEEIRKILPERSDVQKLLNSALSVLERCVPKATKRFIQRVRGR